MCTCDERRFEQAQEFIIELADKLIPMSAYNMQKLRFSVVQVRSFLSIFFLFKD